MARRRDAARPVVATAPSRLPSAGAHARRHPQRRDRRARRPRQDDARRRDALAVRLVPREPGRRRARHGLDGPRAREGHHDPREEHRRHATATSKINIVDTPGHADFGGEVERALRMVDGVLLLVDASEGPLPQTRFVLRKALEARLPVRPRRQQGRPSGRARRRGRQRGLRALPRPRRRREPDRVPDRLLQRPRRDAQARRSTPLAETPSSRSSTRCSRRSPRRRTRRATRCRRSSRTSTHRRTSAGSRSAGSRNGTIRKGQQVAWCRADGSIERAKVTELYVTEALDRVDADEAGPGRSSRSRASPEVTIGETLADPDDPRPLPVVEVDEPSLSMTIGINSSPLAGQEGSKLTAPMVKQRLDQELVGNVSLRVVADRAARHVGGAGPRRAPARGARRADAARGLRAHGRQAAGRHARGRRQGARARRAGRRSTSPRSTSASSPSCFALRKGRMEHMVNHGTGWVRIEVLVPARGLIGFRTEFLTETRGTGILHHVFDRYEPWHGELRTRPSGSLVADRRGPTTTFALLNLQERGSLFVGPGRRGLRGDGRRRERARRGPRRQRDEGEEADEHPLVDRRGARAPDPAAARCRSSRRSSSSATTSASR